MVAEVEKEGQVEGMVVVEEDKAGLEKERRKSKGMTRSSWVK